MGTPINIVHITDQEIINGIKWHVTSAEREKISAIVAGVDTTVTFVTSADFDNQLLKFKTLTLTDGIVTNISSETPWQ